MKIIRLISGFEMLYQSRTVSRWFVNSCLFLLLSVISIIAQAHNSSEWMDDLNDHAVTGSSHFKVKAISSQTIGSGYLQVEGIMFGKLKRAKDGVGTYQVPVTLVYPEDEQQCNGVAIEEVVNSVFYETFATTGTANDPLFPTLFPFGRLILGDSFIKGKGYVYGLAQWNKLVIERQRQSGTLSNASFHIERANDAFTIIKDLSAFFRNPTRYFVGHQMPTPCQVDDVIGFGYSQTGMLLRKFYFDEKNSKLANSHEFDDQLVFEGSIHGVPGGHCRSVIEQPPYYSYSFENCTGATPESQGKVMTINAETDVQIVAGWLARSLENSHHYKVYEIAGASHIPTTVFDLKQLGIRPANQATQNFADIGPVYRAMIVNLHNWIDDQQEPPNSEVMQGSAETLFTPFFSSQSWGSDQNEAFVLSQDEGGNALGGIRLPHLRTTLDDASQVGAALGIYRGTQCDNDPESNSFILNCLLSSDPNIYNMAAGSFHPYTEINPDLCTSYYPDAESYIGSVRAGAEYALSNGWILQEELENIVTSALTKAGEFSGCVPGGL